MNNIQVSKKYDELFMSAVNFAHQVQLCQDGEIAGSSDEAITAFEKKHNVKYPAALRSYLRHFGKKARFRDTDYNCAFSLNDFEYALDHSRRKEEWHDMKNMQELLDENNYKINYDDECVENEASYTPPIKYIMDVKNAIPFYYDNYQRRFDFVDCSKENPIVFSYMGYNLVTSNYITFSNAYRDVMFHYIMKYAEHEYAPLGMLNNKSEVIGPPPNIDFTNCECLRDYIKIQKNSLIPIDVIRKYRQEYYRVNDLREQQEDRVQPFCEFENGFMEFLRRVGGYKI